MTGEPLRVPLRADVLLHLPIVLAASSSGMGGGSGAIAPGFMGVTLLCVGKLRERYYADAAAEYVKRLRRLMPVTLAEVPDESEPAKPLAVLQERVLRREGDRILSYIAQGVYVIALCAEGAQWTSPEFADKLQGLFTRGKSDVTFVIGGSLGLHEDVLNRADERLSMGRLTFPHTLARVMLLEQLFRAAKINAGERYHK
ncbi:MAG: 23S rRNA (pseudouridine(1915)-N(3))-methyltransferase RlmH [Clostridia bacterium]|nr:23S rRNA (pseudouridine(1915)-N(3))-methyltransferase RlmH [Clostridia bacterium]